MLGRFRGKRQVECHFVGFPVEKKLGVLEMPGAPQKPKWAGQRDFPKPHFSY